MPAANLSLCAFTVIVASSKTAAIIFHCVWFLFFGFVSTPFYEAIYFYWIIVSVFVLHLIAQQRTYVKECDPESFFSRQALKVKPPVGSTAGPIILQIIIDGILAVYAPAKEQPMK